MITKLKYLSTLYKRDVLPAAGSAIGKILYTAKYAVGLRPQFVFDVDANTVIEETITAAPADPTTLPGAVTILSFGTVPLFDRKLYIDGDLIATISAVADTITVTTHQGSTGVSPVIANVLTNDLYNGAAPASTTKVTLVQVSHDAPLTLNTSTGAITLAASTPSGTYHLVYSATDKNEPSVTSSATVTVIVNTTIVATADSVTVPLATGTSGATGVIANVLTNDTYNGVAPASLTDVTLSVVSHDAPLTLHTGTGAIDLTSSTAAGTYTVVYRLTDNYDNTVTTTGTATVIVNVS